MTSLLAALVALAVPAPQEDREAVRKAFDLVHKSFLGIDVTLRKKTRLEKAELEEEALDAEAQRILQLAENDQPLETWGVAVAPDLILLPDHGLKPSDVEKIEAVDATGARFGARLAGVGRTLDFVLLRPDPPRELTPLSFGEWKEPRLGETFHVTYADRVDHRWHLNVSPYIQTNAPLVGAKDWFCIDLMRPGSVVGDKDGVPVGIALDQYLWVRPDGRSSFLGKAILADERVTDLEKRYETIRRAIAPSVKKIEILFRADRPAERYMPPEDAKAGRASVFGVALDDQGTLFVPEELTRDMVRKIEDLRIVEGGQVVPATFVGSFRGFGGFLVRAEGLRTVPGIAPQGAAPPPGDLFFTARFEDRFGRSRIQVEPNRLFRTERGLAGAARLQPRRRLQAGTFLLDFEGRIVGCATSDRKEEDLDDVALEASRERFALQRSLSGYGQEHLRRLLYFSEIRDVLAQPASHFDPRAMPMTKKEEKRLVWLGVEYQEVSKPIAEALGIQERDLTNDGRRGLVITEIYAGSPAEKAGLRVDDLLLSVQPEGEASARDLVAEVDRFGFGRMGGGMRERGGPPWKPVRNYLSTMLTEIGASRKAVFEVLRGKEKSKVTVPLEIAPVDFETAERHKDDALGFTVKELTYEVRHFQKLDPAVMGVVVVKVESGSRADVAKLPPLSIITRVNDQAVRDLAHFREVTASGKGLTLTTLSFGQTRLVELPRE
jgi:S1-C subfamily serine protease